MLLLPAKKQKTPVCIREIQVHKLWTKVYSQKGLTTMKWGGGGGILVIITSIGAVSCALTCGFCKVLHTVIHPCNAENSKHLNTSCNYDIKASKNNFFLFFKGSLSSTKDRIIKSHNGSVFKSSTNKNCITPSLPVCHYQETSTNAVCCTTTLCCCF